MTGFAVVTFALIAMFGTIATSIDKFSIETRALSAILSVVAMCFITYLVMAQ